MIDDFLNSRLQKIARGSLHNKISLSTSYIIILNSLGEIKIFGIKDRFGSAFFCKKENTIVWAIA